MKGLQVVLIFVLGAVGTLLRYGLSRWVGERFAGTFPWGTLLVNLSGALALGLLTGGGSRWLAPPWPLALGTGLIGGYTTFSTLTWESLRLLESGKRAAALFNLFGSAALGLAAAALGAFVARLIWV